MVDSEAAQNKERLRALLMQLSFRQGEFVLASGRRAQFYIDCRQTTLHAEGAWLVGEVVFAFVEELRRQEIQVLGVGGMSLGADPIAVATAMVSQHRGGPVHSFLVRKEGKTHGTRAAVEGLGNLPPGSPVVLVEDTVTTGSSTLRALEQAEKAGLVVVGIFALVDRQEGGSERLASTGLTYRALFSPSDLQTE